DHRSLPETGLLDRVAALHRRSGSGRSRARARHVATNGRVPAGRVLAERSPVHHEERIVTQHLSALALDALALDALDCAAPTAAARAPLAICERCRTDLERATELRAHFTVAVLPRTLPRRRHRTWSLMWLAVPALGALAAVWIGRDHVRPARDGAGSELAIKG